VTARQCHIRVALEGRSNRESHNLIMIGHVTPWGLHFRAPLPQPPSTSTGERDEAKGRNKKSPNPEPSFLVCRLLSLPPSRRFRRTPPSRRQQQLPLSPPPPLSNPDSPIGNPHPAAGFSSHPPCPHEHAGRFPRRTGEPRPARRARNHR
jgi:hypothetical protein